MVKNQNVIILILLLFFLTACYPRIILGELCDDRLSLERENYYRNELRIDGYYSEFNDKYCRIYFIYNNGVLLNKDVAINNIEKEFIDDGWVKRIKKLKHNWGLYRIEGTKITLEHWHPSSGPLLAYIRSGEILNDTTFLITKCMRSNGREVSTKNEVYHFRQFSPKPDSTNAFIK